ncbi:uncharacterized protein GIQ15_03860 [Arthroderma uncinatum]|uniref:uncharacterized protein n=1 Tax=Arthroderma uncinatum TaxID=74035 RepID=UPI00144ABE33|nr:uncharacterized protein GIQ15_03860 [Arthroderma uncinatum]KAF3481101.1 hypothetical protein GIQ15_03860 [Arthroderma uncinatum]
MAVTIQSSDEWTSNLESEEGEESQVDYPEDTEIKKKIDKALHSIDSKGDFASFHSINRELNPNLHINGLGRVVNLPLSPEDAKSIIDVCHRSPFGKGTETLVDTSVRKCWELNAADFELKAPGWGNYMKKVIADVSKGLGIADKASSIRADPYKLLLYEEGAFFLSHQDSPKTDGMFATLIVCLPTEHEGGEIVLNHDSRSLIFKSSTTSRAGFSYAVWYSDVFHEIRPITAGHRLVLTYNLIHDGTSNVPTAPTSKATPLSIAMQLWKSRIEKDAGPSLLLYKLSHMYTDSSLSFQRLKGRDHQRMVELQMICQDSDFALYLGNVERRVYGGCDDYPGNNGYYEIEDLCDDDSSLKKVVDAEGNIVGTGLTIEPLDFVQRRVLDGKPTEEDYSGYTGNEGTSVTHFYRKTVAVIVPGSLDVDFRFRGMTPRNEADLAAWLNKLLPLISDPEDSKSREDFTRIAKLTFNHNEVYKKYEAIKGWSRPRQYWDKFSDSIISLIAKGLYTIKDLKMFEESIRLHSSFVDPVLYPCIAEALADREYPAVKKAIEAILAKTEPRPSKQVITVDGLVSACLALPDDKRPVEWDDLMKWRKARLLSILPWFHGGDKSGGECLIRIAELYPEMEILEKTMESRRMGRVSGVIASYLAQLGESFTTGKLAIEGFPAFYESALANLMTDFELAQSTLENYDVSSRPLRKNLDLGPLVVDSSDLIKIYRQCQTLGIPPARLYAGIHKSLVDCQAINVAFTSILVPFLRDIVSHPLIDEGQAPETRFVLKLLLEYVLMYVQPRARAAASWERPVKSSCGCKDCNDLNAFLKSPVQQSADFPMAKPRRAHIHSKLDGDASISHETRRQGSPYTLVVTKIGNPATLWKNRAVIAVRNINRIGSAAEMEAYLGSSAYKSLIDLDIVVKGGSVSDYIGNEEIGGRKRAATSELNRTENRSGREIEVIDLTK